MAFTQVNKQRGLTKETNTVTMSCPKGQAVISITGDIFELIGSPRWAEVFVGEGDDAGTILITPCAEAQRNAYSVWSSDRVPNLHKVGIAASRLSLNHPFKTTEVAFKIVPEGIIVTLPASEPKPQLVMNRRAA